MICAQEMLLQGFMSLYLGSRGGSRDGKIPGLEKSKLELNRPNTIITETGQKLQAGDGWLLLTVAQQRI